MTKDKIEYYVNLINSVKLIRLEKYIDPKVLQSIPECSDIRNALPLHGFSINKPISCKQVDDLYEEKGLIPNITSFINYIKLNIKLIGEKKLAMQWKGDRGEWFYLLIYRDDDKTHLSLQQNFFAWPSDWSFVGCQKKP